ncbi:MAG: hypothetical protein IPK71_11530 [Myxococcales bacterium]|nr:hypothetical protein [Myxococcales bacterium]
MTDDPTRPDDALLRALGARLRAHRDEPLAASEVPVFDEARSRTITDAILSGAPAPSPEVAAPPRTDTTTAEPPRQAEVVPLRPRVSSPLRRLGVVLAPLAAAAALVFWFLGRPASAPLPTYDMSVVGVRATRSDPATAAPSVVLDPSGALDVVARPSSSVGVVSARGYVVSSGSASPIEPASVSVSPEGAVRIHGENTRIFPRGAGSYVLVVVLTRASSPLSADEGTRLAEGKVPPGPGVAVLRADVTVRRAD